MTDTRIDEIKARIVVLRREQDALVGELAEAQRAEWDTRVDDIKVQAHLGAMDLRDRVTPILEELRDRILALRSEIADADGTTLTDVYDALRRGFAAAVTDIAAAARDARDTVAARHATP